jgi:putative PEP-CTERM system TPR-repeat lipoprotein
MRDRIVQKRLLLTLCHLLACAVLLTAPVISSAPTTETYLKDAADMYSRGEYSAALIQVKNALLLNPDNAQAHLLLGKIHLKAGDAVTASRELGLARELGIDETEWLVPLARAYLALGRSDDAIRLLSTDSDYPDRLQAELLQLQGQAYVRKQQFAEAAERFSAALALDPESVEAMLGKAYIDIRQGNNRSADELVGRVLAIEPDNSIAWTRKGELLMRSGDMQEALAAFRKALVAAPGNLTAAVRQASARIELGDYDVAAKETGELLARHPRLYTARYLNALAYFHMQQLEPAQQSIRQVVEAVPAHTPSQLLAGVIAYRLGEYDRAGRYLQTCHNRNPSNHAVTKLLGATLVKRNKPGEACAVMETGASAAGEDVQYLGLLGSACMAAGDAVRGLEYLERAAAIAPDIAAIRTQLALGQLAHGATDEGIRELQGAVDLGQGVLQADVMLVMVYLQQREFDRAYTAAEALAGKRPDNPVPHNLAGVALLGKGDHRAARAAFEEALRLQSEFLPAQLNLAKLAMLEGDTVAASAGYHKVLSRDEDNLKALLGLAALAGREQQVQDELRWLKQAHDGHPAALEPARLLVQYHLRRGDTRQAGKLATELAHEHPDNPMTLQTLGQVQLAAGEYREAVSTLRSLVRLSPRSAEAHYLLGMALLKKKDSNGARRSLRQALGLQPDYPAAQFALGELLIVERDYEAALEMANALHRKHPESAWSDELRGDVYTARREYRPAEAAYIRARERTQSARLARKLFTLRSRAGDHEAARAVLRQWLEAQPADVEMRILLATALHADGQGRAAIEQYLKVLQYDPRSVQALNNLAWLYHEQGSGKGLDYAERAYALVPGRPEIIDTLGWLEVQHGRLNRGLLLLQEAVALAPRKPGIRYHMAVALEKAGRRDEALAELDRLLRAGKEFPDRVNAHELRERLR